MKINYRVFKTLTGEPFVTQEINGKEVGFYKMNETKFLQENVSRGRFYLWTSDGNTYKLVVEEGFYNKVSYFFEEKVNAVWINFLEEVSALNSKTSKTFLFGSLGISLFVIIGATLLDKFAGGQSSNYMMYGIIVALVITMVGNMIQSNKVNKSVREKNLNAQNEIRDILTEKKFNQLLKDQEEYMKEYFEFLDEELEDDFEDEFEENNEDEINDLVLEEIASEVVLANEEIKAELTKEVEEVKLDKTDYNEFTVAVLRDMAKDRNLVGYSGLKKADLIKLLEEEDNK